jgi:circadian clock protein KaiC
VAKLRGSAHLTGHHAVAIGSAGFAVSPRLEAALGAAEPPALDTADRVPFGVAGLDAMRQGGLPRGAVALIMGPPGAGKTVLGLHFAAEGARRGETVLVAGFREGADALAATAAGLGLGLAPHLASGLVRVHWRPPLELSPDAWGWELLAAVERHRPRRLVVDAYTDLARAFGDGGRAVGFLTALANELRARGVTTQFNAELDAWAGQSLLPPIPAVSAATDVGVLLRVAELGSRLVRVASVLKAHGTGFDHAIRQLAIGPGGMAIGGTVDAATGLLTGSAVPLRGNGDADAG